MDANLGRSGTGRPLNDLRPLVPRSRGGSFALLLILVFRTQFLKQIKAKGGGETPRLFYPAKSLFPGPRLVLRRQVPHVFLDQGDNVIAKRSPILFRLYFGQFQQILGTAERSIFTHRRFLFGHFCLFHLHNGRQRVTPRSRAGSALT